MKPADNLALFLHFLSLSFFATGGTMMLAPEMHRYVVGEMGYISHDQFLASIALAQAMPGPNILFVTVMGWQISGFAGALATTMGIIIPSLTIPLVISRAGRHPILDTALQAFKRGLAPVAIGLMAT